MHPSQTTLALPGDTLGDLSPNWDTAASGNFLALWTSLWHPRLLAATGRLPDTVPVDTLVHEPLAPGHLMLVPDISQTHLGEPVLADEAMAPRVQQFASRGQVISHLAELLELPLEQDSQLTADFYALGFAYLQIELLTRSMRYDREVTQESLRTAVVGAAAAALAGDQTALDTHLSDAYDQLMQSRNHYYPIDFYLIDLSLTAATTVGEAFRQECQQASQLNVLVTSEVLDHMAAQEPESLVALRTAIDEKRVTVCGSTRSGAPLAELAPETLLAELKAARSATEQHLGHPPRVFANHAGPMAPLVPGVLNRLGYHAAVMSNFAGYPLPAGVSSRTTWTGLDNMSIEALAAEPIDVGSATAMLGLSQQMQHTMNYDLAASLLLVGWPGHRTEWHADLMQVTRRSTLLGRPITLGDYFDQTSSHDYSGITPASDYPSTSRVIDSVSSASQQVAALAQLAGATGEPPAAFRNLLGASESAETPGTLWINASSLDCPMAGGSLPGCGWRWLPAIDTKAQPPRCEPGVLRNEHLEVVFDPTSGGISATRFHDRRGNHLSQQLAVAPLGPPGIAAGLQLAPDGWEVAESSDTRGTLVSRYRVVDRDGKSLAAIRQRTTLQAHSRNIDIEVSFEPLADRAKHCAVASRIAVRDEDFVLSRGLQGIDLPTGASRVRSACVGLASEISPMAVLCDQVRLHYRHSGRMLDTTLFEAAGENTTAALSYVLDGRYPAQAYSVWRQAESVVALPAATPRQPSGWWFRVGAANVMVTHLEVEDHGAEGRLLRVRLLETAGRAVHTTLATWQTIEEAQQVNFLGEPDQLLRVEEGRVPVSLAAYEFVEVLLAIGDGQ
ncbi:hypothetical protein NG895_24240 [Aeoliella sp. ICT_H6.2]|uniref:Uncharacterized protein n=2 Tax=Aeoliella straminimaris TaxID=2954799 RepID=A0A9X2JIN4_9BACT|nr:hypothetical protein [Aeoliella straminimaris]